MAGNNTVWQTPFTADGRRSARRRDLAALVTNIGQERAAHPAAAEGPRLPRLELLARVLWTRAVVDGDMTAIKLLIELLTASSADGAAVELHLEDFAEAEQRIAATNAALARSEEAL